MVQARTESGRQFCSPARVGLMTGRYPMCAGARHLAEPQLSILYRRIKK
jgi:hypothetical protein